MTDAADEPDSEGEIAVVEEALDDPCVDTGDAEDVEVADAEVTNAEVTDAEVTNAGVTNAGATTAGDDASGPDGWSMVDPPPAPLDVADKPDGPEEGEAGSADVPVSQPTTVNIAIVAGRSWPGESSGSLWIGNPGDH